MTDKKWFKVTVLIFKENLYFPKNGVNGSTVIKGSPLLLLTCFFYFNLSRPDYGRREKINLIFYFPTSFWCIKRLYEGFKGPHSNFQGTTKKWENKNIS